ncbi:MAG: hypothetical protein V1908_04425 [Candidatus Peregrinibacteria bacterium]
MRFKYTALSQNNQKVEGALTADSAALAKGELHKMGFAIIGLQEIPETQYQELNKPREATAGTVGAKVFVFSATDPQGKPIEGTIDAPEPYAAFRRLVTEYGFLVKELYPEKASAIERQAALTQIKTLEQKLNAEGIALPSPRPAGELELEEEPLNPELLKEIDGIIKSGKEVLSKHQALFSAARLREIESRLGDLQRIRTSNNVKHIAEVSNTLLELIRRPDQGTETDRHGAGFQQTLAQLQNTAVLEDELKHYKKALGVKNLKGIFDELKKRLGFIGKKIDPKTKTHSPLWNKIKLYFPVAKKHSVTAAKEEVTPSGLKKIGMCLLAYWRTPNEVAKKTRKYELIEAWKEWRQNLESPTPSLSSVPKTPGKTKKPGKDFGLFFMEADSFTSWLLFFYLAYFFLVDFSLEKNVGLPATFVTRTLRSPLLLNIALGLLVTHWLLRIKTRSFRQNALGSIFLFLFGYGLYCLMIFNF